MRELTNENIWSNIASSGILGMGTGLGSAKLFPRW
jgi:hypothetical protein